MTQERCAPSRKNGCARSQESAVVHHRLVVEGDGGDLGRQREHDVEVTDGQEVSLPLGEPRARGCPLTFWTMPISAAVVSDAPMAAVLACLDVTAESRCPALFNRRHDLELVQAQVAGMGHPVSGPRRPEDIGDLKGGPHRLSRRARLLWVAPAEACRVGW